MDINDFIDFENKTIAEFHVAITEIEEQILSSIKEKDFIKAYKYAKLKIKLETLLTKKVSLGNKHGYDKKGNIRK